MTRLTVVVTNGTGVGFTRKGHPQADVVAKLVAQHVDGELVITNGHDVAVVADQSAWAVERRAARPCRRRGRTRQAEHQRVHAPAQAGQTRS
eukprot:2711780-Pleurochrysis_carterae.AAC.4